MLITAFLVLQWSSTHIHLAGQHDHDGAEHQHEVLSHQHQSGSGHIDALVDVAENTNLGTEFGLDSHVDSSGVVELSHDCTNCYSQAIAKLVSQFPPALLLYTRSRSVPGPAGFYSTDLPYNYLAYSLPAVRAPPVFA